MIPKDARVLPLTAGSKVPLKGSRGHHDAKALGDLSEQEYAQGFPGGNYGIALDGQFVVVDFDSHTEETEKWKGKLPPTWQQKTRRGEHWLYRVPAGVDSAAASNKKFAGGDVKVRGYIVGPGSTVAGHDYIRTNDLEPAEAPVWLWEFVTDAAPVLTTDSAVEEREAFGEGTRDDSLYKVGSLFRRLGLGETGIVKGLWGINKTIIDPPLSKSDIYRIGKSAYKHEPVDDDMGALVPSGWLPMNEVTYVGPPTRWWVRGFVPKGELVMFYGPGSVGKSTWGSWLTSVVTHRGGRVAVMAVEESPKRFAWRALLNGADPALILAIPKASTVLFPRDADALREALLLSKTDLLYIDSIYTHFGATEGQNAAERARSCLSPLAEICQETGVTIVAVFHENKAGQYLGSVEMLNVPRYVLRAQRSEGRPLYVSVDKTNLWDPGVAMTLTGKEVAASDPFTGEVQLEEADDGTLIPMNFVVLDRGEDAAKAWVNVDEVVDNEAKGPSTAELVAKAVEEHPDFGTRALATLLDISRNTVKKYLPWHYVRKLNVAVSKEGAPDYFDDDFSDD